MTEMMLAMQDLLKAEHESDDVQRDHLDEIKVYKQ
jgi:hypothetical protein